MGYSYDYAYSVGEDVSLLVLMSFYVVYYLIAIGFGIAAYILSSAGFYTIAKRRQLNHPWLAWVPVANAWIVGSLSDQYRYVKKGQTKSKRKILLTLECILAALAAAAVVVVIVEIVGIVPAVMSGREDAIYMEVMSMVLWIMLIGLGAFGVGIAHTIVRYMAMYDIYTSMDPSTNVLFLVLSILFNVTEPFFVFCNRKKDLGMPPRREAAQEPVQFRYLDAEQEGAEETDAE